MKKIAEFPITTYEQFVLRMKTEKVSHDRRYAPSSFSLSAPLALIPAYRRDVWPQLQRVIDETKTRTIITFLPAILQLDIPVFTTLQSRGSPGVSVASNNTAVAVEAIRQLNAEGAVATQETARVLEAALMQPAAPSIRYWYVVLPIESALYRSSVAPVFHDLHVMPGVSIAAQCTTLARSGENVFHPSPDYVWESDDDQLIISSIDDRSAPLFRFRACRGKITEKPCSCGARFLLSRYE